MYNHFLSGKYTVSAILQEAESKYVNGRQFGM